MNQTGNQLYKTNEELIQSTFLELLKEKQISRITIREICEIANINRSTFYRHYEDIYALMQDIQKNIFTEFLNDFLETSMNDNYITLENLTFIIGHIQKYRIFYYNYLNCNQTNILQGNISNLWEDYFIPMFKTHGVTNERYMKYYFTYFFIIFHIIRGI